MNCKFCGAECANIGELNKHKPTCPNRPADKPTETSDCSHFAYDFSPAQHKLMQLYWGRDYTDPLKERFEALIADMVKPEEEEHPEEKLPESVIYRKDLPKTVDILGLDCIDGYLVLGHLDKERNLHVDEVRYPAPRRRK